MTLNDNSIKILFANDGSSHAKAAIDLICDLSQHTKINIRMIGVLLPRESSNHQLLSSVLDQTIHIFKNYKLESSSEIILGYPQDILIEKADQMTPDLIIMGAQGLRGTLGIFLGGVAQQVVEYACCPVLVVRSPFTRIIKIALVTDGSQSSRYAIDFLTGNSGMKDSSKKQTLQFSEEMDLQVIHVLPAHPSPELIARSWTLGPELLQTYTHNNKSETEWIEEYEPRGKEILNSSIEMLNKCGIKAKGNLLWGDAATEIINFSNNENIDLIIAGSRGLSQIQSVMLGSVSRKLVHYAKCSVLIVKDKQHGMNKKRA